MTTRRRAIALFLGAVIAAACSPSPSPNPSASAPAPSPAETGAPTPAPTPTQAPSLPAQTAAHLDWTKAKTNLPPRVANTGIWLAMRSQGSPRYVGVDAFYEVWTSDDGTTWELDKNDFETAPGPWTLGIHPLGTGLVAFDRYLDYMNFGDGGPYDALSDGKTWRSDDGRAWTSHQSPIAFVGGLVADDHLVAIGGNRGQYVPTIATSTDGSTWTTVPRMDEPWPGNSSCWWTVRSLAGSAAAGYLVQASQAGPLGAECGTTTAEMVWRSTELASWTRVLEGTAECPRINEIVHGPRGFVAVGSGATDADGDATSCAWVSRDGVTWTAATIPPPVVISGVRQLAIAPDGTFLAYGDEIWESTDGMEWYLSAPATNVYVYEFAGDLALGCGKDKTCSSLRMGAR